MGRRDVVDRARRGRVSEEEVVTVKLKNQGSGSASFRVSAADTAGRAVTQTVIDAYAVD